MMVRNTARTRHIAFTFLIVIFTINRTIQQQTSGWSLLSDEQWLNETTMAAIEFETFTVFDYCWLEENCTKLWSTPQVQSIQTVTTICKFEFHVHFTTSVQSPINALNAEGRICTVWFVLKKIVCSFYNLDPILSWQRNVNARVEP